MGMKIDDHIEVLKSYNHGFTGYAGNLQDSIDVAIDTMRRYQKILKILNSSIYFENGKVYSYTYDDTTRLRHIREVIADGNDD